MYEGEDRQVRQGRQAKIQDLEQTVQTLRARLEARDAIIRRQQAKIQQLQEIIARHPQTVIVGKSVNV